MIKLRTADSEHLYQPMKVLTNGLPLLGRPQHDGEMSVAGHIAL